MPAKLRALRFDQAANLVDDPANPQARIVLFKRAVKEPPLVQKESPMAMTKKTFFEKLSGLFKAAEAGPLVDWASEEETEHGMLKAFADKLGAALSASVDGAGLAGQFKALHTEMTEKLAEAAARKEAAAAACSKQGEDEEGRVTKAQEAISKQVVDLQKKLDETEARAIEAEKIAKSERDARELESEKTTLRKFRHVTVDVDKEAESFAKLRLSNKEAYDLVLSKMNAAEAVAAKAKLLEQDLGSPLSGEGAQAWAEIEAEADKMVAKGEKGITKEKAIDRVMKMRPDLVARHKAETTARVQ